MSRTDDIKFDNLVIRGRNNGLAGGEGHSFWRDWARGGDTVNTPSGWPTTVGRDGNGNYISDRAANLYSSRKRGFNQEVLDLAGGTSVTSTNNLLPANSIIEFIVCTPVVELSTPTTYHVGDETTNTRFATSLTNDGSSSLTAAQFAKAHWAGTVAITQTSAGKVKLTANAAGTGKILVTVWYTAFAGSLA
jgi:hypothetical protein